VLALELELELVEALAVALAVDQTVVRVVDPVADLEPGLVPEWERVRVLAWHNRPKSNQPPV